MEKQLLACDKEVQIVLKALDMFFNRTNKSSRRCYQDGNAIEKDRLLRKE